MSRFIAHVQQSNGAEMDIDCDDAHLNEDGALSLSINTHLGAIARWQPHAWISYQLETPPPGHPSADSSFTSINEERDRLAAPQQAPEDADSHPRAKADMPHADDTVHLIAPGRPGCTVALVYRVNPNGSLVLGPYLDASPYPREIVQDQAAQCATSWHWPCSGDRQGVTPAPDGPEPTVITVRINGELLADALRYGRRNR